MPRGEIALPPRHEAHHSPTLASDRARPPNQNRHLAPSNPRMAAAIRCRLLTVLVRSPVRWRRMVRQHCPKQPNPRKPARQTFRPVPPRRPTRGRIRAIRPRTLRPRSLQRRAYRGNRLGYHHRYQRKDRPVGEFGSHPIGPMSLKLAIAVDGQIATVTDKLLSSRKLFTGSTDRVDEIFDESRHRVGLVRTEANRFGSQSPQGYTRGARSTTQAARRCPG